MGDVDLEQEAQEGRGSSVEIEKAWLNHLHKLWHQMKDGSHPKAGGRKWSLEEFGRELARTSGRARGAWSKVSVSRFLNGQQPSDDLLRAFCSFFDLDYPIVCARHPDEIRWFQIGRSIRSLSKEEFADAVKQAHRALSFAKKDSDLDHELEPAPE